jgi:flagellar hook protein FlgE
MSIGNNLFIGVSGLMAHGEAISVVGDNIANVSTVGFKSSRAGFADVLGGTVAQSRVGAGVRMNDVQANFGQGTLQQTGGVLDLAVNGRGFFAVRGNHGGLPGTYYTRDGRFNIDNQGFIVNPEGLRLQGYPVDITGTQTLLGDIELGNLVSQPAATTLVDTAVNLDAASVPPLPFDPADPNDTSNFATSTTVFDSLGAAHRVDMYFRTNGGGNWEWHALVDGAELTGGLPGIGTEIATGTLQFNTNGELDIETTTASSADFVGATPAQAIVFDFGDAITTDVGTGLGGSTQFAGASTVTLTSQNGHGFGALVDIQVTEDGIVNGLFSNGENRPVARVALAIFAAEEELTRAGDQLFRENSKSGQALVDAAANGGRGTIVGGTLEQSNVDLTNELVHLIAFQRAFQANVKTVTVADEMLLEVANLKR